MSCGNQFNYYISSPGITVIDTNIELGQTYGNIDVTISSTTFNQQNEVFVGNIGNNIGEVFTFTSGTGSQTKTVGFVGETKTTLDVSVFSQGTSSNPFVPFTITIKASCPTLEPCYNPNPQ